MKTFRDIMLHLIVVPILIGTVSYLSLDEDRKNEIKNCLKKKMKKEEKLLKDCLCD